MAQKIFPQTNEHYDKQGTKVILSDGGKNGVVGLASPITVGNNWARNSQ
jgi:hypothetical protein